MLHVENFERNFLFPVVNSALVKPTPFGGMIGREHGISIVTERHYLADRMKAVVIVDEDPPSIACHLSDYAVGLPVSLTPRRYKTCRISAFAYHDLTDAIPTALDIAIPRGREHRRARVAVA
jgi:hypothetical protein